MIIKTKNQSRLPVKKIKILFLSIFFYSVAHGQGDSTYMLKKNSVYGELGGNAILYSLNYERLFYQKNKTRLCARIGFSTFTNPRASYALLPIETNILIGKKHNYFEAGIGATFCFNQHPLIFTRIGYRLQIPTGDFLIRLAVLPCLIYELEPAPPGVQKKYRPLIWGGISFGYSL